MSQQSAGPKGGRTEPTSYQPHCPTPKSGAILLASSHFPKARYKGFVHQHPEAGSRGFRLSRGKTPSASPGGQVQGWEEPGLCMGTTGDSCPVHHNDPCPPLLLQCV